MDIYLCIADFLVSVHSNSENDKPICLQSNYTPFLTQKTNDYPLLYQFVIEEHFNFESSRKELRRYQTNNRCYVVYITESQNYQFETYNSSGTLVSKLQTDKKFKGIVACLFGTLCDKIISFNNAIMMCYAFAIALNDGFLIHSSAISYNKQGYLFLGKSGTGKSTHSQLWLKKYKECELINDDNPIVRIVNNKAIVYGSPWSGKTSCYKQLKANVGGVVLLEQKNQNNIRHMTVVEALSALLVSCSIMSWDEHMFNSVYENAAKFLNISQFYHLGCLPNDAAVDLCRKTIEL